MTDTPESNVKLRGTPGVYATELTAFPASIVGVATAVPIFVGYTEFAGTAEQPLYLSPVPIDSLSDYQSRFGGAAAGGASNLAQSIKLFYENGGDGCYVVSAGSYLIPPPEAGSAEAEVPSGTTSGASPFAAIDADTLLAGLAVAGNQVGPTMLVVPEACTLAQADYARVASAMIAQAAAHGDRMAILDIPGSLGADSFAALETAHTTLTIALSSQPANLRYGAAYAPALVLPDGSVVPASGAIAGAWTANDGQRGVWSAPANIALAGVDRPLYSVNDDQQGSLNAPVNGVAIDVIRSFVGRGTIIWGARTLDGNSLDYRYVQVQRTLIYIEQSIKTALDQYAFAANDQQTWTNVVASVTTFLEGLWSQGGLLGESASDAFTVQCGTPQTMTAEDILDGYMIVQVTLQMIRPAEFIELTFKQKMQGV